MPTRTRRVNKSAIIMAVPSIFFLFLSIFGFSAPVKAATIPNTGFEDGTFTGWDRGAQTGTLGNTITQNGSGVTIFTGSRTFTHGSNPAVGSPSSQYYAPAVPAGSWTFSPSGETKAVLLQPKNQQTFNQAVSALNLSAGAVTEIRNILTSQAQASGNGGGTPTDAAWITREVALEAGTTYTMAWNYVGTDYVPFNDGSITSLVPVTVTGTPVVTVNNYVKQYALLGFTNPGTGDYSTNSYGATGWQTSTYEVSISGTYELGFASFNLDDTGLPPALMVDSEIGSTERCISSTCTSFGGVPSNNETAPTVAPTTTTTSTTSTTSTTTTTSSTVAPTTTTSTTTTSSTTTSTTTVPVTTTTSTTVYVGNGDTTTTSTSTTSTTITTTTVYVPPVVVVIPPVDAGPVDSGTTTSTYPAVVILPVDTTLPLETTTTIPTITIPTTPPAGTSNGNGLTPTTLLIPTESTVTTLLPTVIDPTKTETVVINNPWGNSIGTPEEFDKLPENATPTQIGAVIEDVDFTEVTDKNFDKTVDAVFDNIDKPEDVANVIGAFLEADVSDKQLNAVLDKVFDGPMTASQTTEILEGLLDGPVTATQLEAIMDKVFEDISDTKETIAVLNGLLDGPLSKQELDSVMEAVFEDISNTKDTVAVLEKLLDGPLSKEELGSAMEAVFSEEATVTQMSAVVGDLLEQKLDIKELDAVFEAAFDGDLSDKETIDLIVDVLKEDLTSEALGSALGAVFDDEVSNEVLVETFTAVLGTELNKESVGVIVDVLESQSISEAQVATVVTLIIQQEGGVDADQATELATSSKVLESIDGSQATAVFASVVVAEVTEETGIQIAEALANAGTDVKESFEEEINVFAGVFDTYTALNSSIDVGTRRSVIAVNLVTSTVALATAAGAIPIPGSNSNPSSPRQDVVARREEEELEEGGAIEGEGPDWIKSISIYKYENGVRTMDWKNFTKKFIYGVMGSGFTLAGATVMYFTLSGLTQQIALWGTLIAFACAMYLHMKEPEN